MAELFTGAVVILIIGFLWFWIARPILIDFGLWPLSRIMSSKAGSVDAPPSSRTSSTPTVRPQQNQIKPEPARDFEQVVAFVRSHNLTDDQAITLLALMHRESGDHFLSANKILEGVGGTAAEVKAQIAALRPKPPAPKVTGRMDRPAGGWGKT